MFPATKVKEREEERERGLLGVGGLMAGLVKNII